MERELASSYLAPGQTYAAVYGGAEAGQVRVAGRLPGLIASQVSYEGEVKIRGQVRALATNQAPPDFRVQSRQAPTQEDRTAALALARELFRQHGVPTEIVSRTRLKFLTRTVVAPSPQSSWIGSFTLETGGEDDLQHDLFLIAIQGAQGLQAELVWLRISETLDEDESAEFVDHADLFGNGHDEVVLRLTSTANHRYVVYRKSRDDAHWEQIFMTDALECR